MSSEARRAKGGDGGVEGVRRGRPGKWERGDGPSEGKRNGSEREGFEGVEVVGVEEGAVNSARRQRSSLSLPFPTPADQSPPHTTHAEHPRQATLKSSAGHSVPHIHPKIPSHPSSRNSADH